MQTHDIYIYIYIYIQYITQSTTGLCTPATRWCTLTALRTPRRTKRARSCSATTSDCSRGHAYHVLRVRDRVFDRLASLHEEMILNDTSVEEPTSDSSSWLYLVCWSEEKTDGSSQSQTVLYKRHIATQYCC